MKKILKWIYMLCFHPILFFKFTITKNLFIKISANIKGTNKMSISKNVSIGYGARINFFDNTKDKKLFLGKNVYISNRVSMIIGGIIFIGDDTVIASDVCIVSENHGMDLSLGQPYKTQKLNFGNIKIGSNCWIGEKVIILPGVEIGDNSIVGSGSVVTKSIPACSIAVGNPAHVIKSFNFSKGEWESVHG